MCAVDTGCMTAAGEGAPERRSNQALATTDARGLADVPGLLPRPSPGRRSRADRTGRIGPAIDLCRLAVVADTAAGGRTNGSTVHPAPARSPATASASVAWPGERTAVIRSLQFVHRPDPAGHLGRRHPGFADCQQPAIRSQPSDPSRPRPSAPEPVEPARRPVRRCHDDDDQLRSVTPASGVAVSSYIAPSPGWYNQLERRSGWPSRWRPVHRQSKECNDDPANRARSAAMFAKLPRPTAAGGPV